MEERSNCDTYELNIDDYDAVDIRVTPNGEKAKEKSGKMSEKPVKAGLEDKWRKNRTAKIKEEK